MKYRNFSFSSLGPIYISGTCFKFTLSIILLRHLYKNNALQVSRLTNLENVLGIYVRTTVFYQYCETW